MVQHDSDELSIEINVDGSQKMGAMPAMVCRHASRQAFRKGDLLSFQGKLALSPIAKTSPALIPVPGVAVAKVSAALADEVIIIVGHASQRTFALLALPLARALSFAV